MTKQWLINKSVVEECGVAAALVHDELLQRYLACKKAFKTTPSELEVVLPYDKTLIVKVMNLLINHGLLKVQFKGDEKYYKVYEWEEVYENN